MVAVSTRSSAIAGRPCDAKACQGLLKWTWKWQGWNDLQMYFKVIKSGTNRKLVYNFLLVVYSNFCRITPFMNNLMWNSPMTLKYAQGHWQSYHLKAVKGDMYVKCSEDSERMKRKSPFSTTPLSFDAPSPANPREYLHKPYTARNYVAWATYLSLRIYRLAAATLKFRTTPTGGTTNWLIACTISPTPSLFVVKRRYTFSQGNMGNF